MTIDDLNLPNKLTFKRSEVTKIARLEGKVIDYWEKEFDCFTASQNLSGEIFYSRRDLEYILKIKNWLIEEKIPKARVKELLLEEKKIINEEKISTPVHTVEETLKSTTDKDIDENSEAKSAQIYKEKLKIIRHTLQDILTILDKNDKTINMNK